MKTKLFQLRKDLQPFYDIIWFLFLFITLDFIWKLCVEVSDDGNSLFILGKDFSSTIQPICLWTAKASHFIIHTILGYKDFLMNGTVLHFDRLVGINGIFVNSLYLRVVWECTGIQQMVLFSLIILFYPGPKKKKLWFIPLSMLLLNAVNILRIVGSALIIKDGFPEWFITFNEWYNKAQWSNDPNTYFKFYIDWFELFHKDVFRWLYYNGVMFILWLVWQERYNIPYQKKKNRNENDNEQ